jgi:hypothetical protein
MNSRMSSGTFTVLLVLLGIIVLSCAVAAIGIGTGRLSLSRSVSEGMPQAQPGQVIVQQPAPTPMPEIVPTREVAQPPVTEIITPTAVPINPPPLTGNEGTDITGIDPQPVNPGDAGAIGTDQSNNQPQTNGSLPPASGVDESVQPFPAGSRPSGSTSSSASSGSNNSGSAGYACGRRVVHVVQPGQNVFRIALRYDTTINAIVWRNSIDDVRTVRPGTRLVVVTCEQR